MDSKQAELQWLLQYLKAPSKAVELIAHEHSLNLSEPSSLKDESVEAQRCLTLRLFLLNIQAPELLDEALILEFASKIDIDVADLNDWLQTLKSPLSEYDAIRQFLTPSPVLIQIQEMLFPRELRFFGHIAPSRYRHEEDLKTTERLEKNHPFSSLARWMSEQLTEQAFELRNNASAVRITQDQFPDLYQRYRAVASRLGIDSPPPIFLAKGPVNAFAGGVEEPFLVIQEGLITQLSEREQEFVLGHELGHVLFSHMLLHMIAQLSVIQGALLAPNVLIGRILAQGLGFQVRSWSRYAELSCDRAGLLACQDLTAATHVLLRFAGVPGNKLNECNIDALLAQREIFETKKEESLGFLFSGKERTHPWVIERLYELLSWAKSDEYTEIINESKPHIQQSFEDNIDTDLILLRLQATLCEAHPRQLDLLSKAHPAKIWLIGTHPELNLADSQIYDLDISNLDEDQASPGDSFLILDTTLPTSIKISEWVKKYDTSSFFFLSPTQETASTLPVSNQNSDRTSLFKWLKAQSKTEFNIQAHQKYWRDQLNFEALQKTHRKAKEDALSIIDKQFEDFSDLNWFRELTPEDRLFAGKDKLIKQIELVSKSAIEAYQRTAVYTPIHLSTKNPTLKDRSPPPSTLEKLTGIGSLAFGALLLPSTPMWLMLGAAGLGVSSMATGEYLRKKSVNALLESQIEDIQEWLKETKSLLCAAFIDLRDPVECDWCVLGHHEARWG